MAVDMYGVQQPIVLFPQPSYVAPPPPPPNAPWFMPPPPPKFPQSQVPNHRHRDIGANRKRGRASGGQDSGPANLHKLRMENKKKTRRYFKGSFGRTPRRTVPRAPSHSPSVLLSAPGSVLPSPMCGPGFHAMTPNPFKPGTAWKNGLGTVDKEAADIGKTMGIDMFGSNAGLLVSKEKDKLDSDQEGDAEGGGSDLEDPFGFDLEFGQECEGTVPASTRARIDEQQAYIAQLEEQNMNLQEKLYLAEQQVRELQARLEGSSKPQGSSDDNQGSLYSESEEDSELQGASEDERSMLPCDTLLS